MYDSFHHRLARLEQRVRAATAGVVVLRYEWRAVDPATGLRVGPAPNEVLTAGQADTWAMARSLLESIPFVKQS